MGTWKTALCNWCGRERQVTACRTAATLTYFGQTATRTVELRLCAECIRERREAGVEVEAV